jgi:TMEM175 potassium channel family protein
MEIVDEHVTDDGRRTRTLQRVTAFTDAVVAIALTLLVLPLVNIADKSPAGESLAGLMGRNRGDLFAAAVSFLVIEQFWRTHRQLYEGLVDYDEGLLTLNTLWLMVVLFLPFPTARLFTEARLRTDSTLLYLGTMIVISLLALAQLWWVGRHPRLRGESDGPLRGRALLPAAAQSATFAAAFMAAVFAPAAGLLLLIALPVIRYGLRRSAIRED